MDDDLQRSLVTRARDGDGAAFAELYAEHEADVAKVCRRLLGSDRAAAEDAGADVFLRARRGLDGLDPDRPFRPWLLAIARNHCIDRLRRRNLEKELFAGGAVEASGAEAPGPSPLSAAVWTERRDALLGAIEELPDRHRLPLVLRYFGELDYAEIADVLGVSRAQVGTLLFRAKRALRERLTEDDR